MGDLINKLMPKVEASPQIQSLKLPKLKKISANNNSLPKLPELKLPKLKTIEI